MVILQLVIGLLAVVGLYLYRRQRIIQKHRQEAIGHIWATFYTNTGDSYSALCLKVSDNEIDAPRMAQEALGKITGKKTLKYLIRQDKTFNIAYPPGKPSWSQTTIPHTIYYEGNPEPQISRDPEKRLEAISTSEFMDNLSDEKMTQLMVQHSEEIDAYREAAMNKINAKVVYLLLVCTIMSTLASNMMDFNILASVSKLLKFWGL